MHDDATTGSSTVDRLEEAERLKLAGSHTEALVILEQLIIEDPENVAALEEVADNELSLEQFDRAEAAAKRAISLDPESYTGHYILGFLYSMKEAWKESLDHLQKANTKKPNNAEILRCLGWVLFQNEKRAQGIVTLERSLNLDNENPLTLCDLGVAYVQTRNFSKAKSLFERALDLDPENPRVLECVQAVERIEKAMRE